jgi:hypothetical protein
MLHQLAQRPDKGRALFSPPLANQNRLWREFSNYVRQAKAYWDAAQLTAGSSAALLYYYAFLNLAKAELLTTRPADIYGQRVQHGLTFSPTRAQSVRGDIVRVANGAFPMLYQKRTGLPLAVGTELSIRSLLRSIPEVGLELADTGMVGTTAEPLFHVVAQDDTAAWVLLGSYMSGFLSDSRHITTRLFRRSFDYFNVSELSNWRDIFSLSRRLIARFGIFQSKATFSRINLDGSTAADYVSASEHLRATLRPYVDDAIDQPIDAVLIPSLLRSRPLPMPASMARYAIMFYVSSLVRYKPSALDPTKRATEAWLFDSFSRETPLSLLANSYSGIVDSPLAFESQGFRL